MISWSKREIAWYADAEGFNSYFDRLAAIVAAQLPSHAKLHDIGCGIGGLAVRLAGYGFSVVAVDSNPQAIDCLTKRIDADKLPIVTVLADYNGLTQQIEYPVFCLCGDFAGDIELLRRWGARRTMVITLDDKFLPFKISETSRNAIFSSALETFLDSNGYSYSRQRLVEEFGQPFLLAEYASEFIRYHNPTATNDELARFCEENLVRLENTVYRYFLPSTKRVSIFVIELK